MADVAIILNNSGNNIYAQTARELLNSPVAVDFMRVLLSNPSQIANTIKIRNSKSVGSASNRDVMLQNYINATNKTNEVIDIPLNPPLVLDGQTYFETVLEGNSEIHLMFFFDQNDIEGLIN